MTTRSVLVKVILKIDFVCIYGTSGCCSVLAGVIPRRFYTIDPVDAHIGIAFGPANTLQEVSFESFPRNLAIALTSRFGIDRTARIIQVFQRRRLSISPLSYRVYMCN